jgi:hypothetical protein
VKAHGTAPGQTGMPQNIVCPSCGRQLLAREEWYGRQVRCPACAALFTVDIPGAELPSEGNEVLGDADEDLPARPLGRRGRARKAVYGPALGLMISASVGMLVGVLWIAIGSLQAAKGVPQPPKDQQARNDEAYRAGYYAGYCCSAFGPGLAPLVTGPVVILGAWRMMKLRSYGLAMTTSIVAMLPCMGVGCFPGIGLGIWSLVVLNREPIRSAFR